MTVAEAEWRNPEGRDSIPYRAGGALRTLKCTTSAGAEVDLLLADVDLNGRPGNSANGGQQPHGRNEPLMGVGVQLGADTLQFAHEEFSRIPIVAGEFAAQVVEQLELVRPIQQL
jgi:hypothetical protein